jgi:hypothetical protein
MHVLVMHNRDAGTEAFSYFVQTVVEPAVQEYAHHQDAEVYHSGGCCCLQDTADSVHTYIGCKLGCCKKTEGNGPNAQKDVKMIVPLPVMKDVVSGQGEQSDDWLAPCNLHRFDELWHLASAVRLV